jgi:hypothetical protein
MERCDEAANLQQLYFGIDLHKNQRQMCILTKAGEMVHMRMQTERPRAVFWTDFEYHLRSTIRVDTCYCSRQLGGLTSKYQAYLP